MTTAQTTDKPDERILDRVRALLNQAESTTFGPEADTFIAKAQELMLKYAVNEAMLRESAHASAPRPQAVRLFIDIQTPYAKAKISLAARVAENNRCKCLYHGAYRGQGRKAIVFGLSTDVEFVEILYTSLLVQCSSEQAKASKDGRSTGASWQNSFFHAFAQKVGMRLQENRRIAEQGLGPSASMLPVLAANIAIQFKKAFPYVTAGKSTKININYAGHSEGSRIAASADISGGRENIRNTRSLPS